MKKCLSPAILIFIFLFFNDTIFALEPITDANSVQKFIRHIETVSSNRPISLTFKSKIDESYQPMLVKIPDGYTKEKSWPLLVVLHGLGNGPIIVPSINSMVQIGPFGRGDMWYRDLGEKDVFECIEFARQIFNIDPDGIYLCGFSMGAAGTFELGLKHPDIWAACVPVCGDIDELELIENGRNLPFWINAGSEDKVIPAKNSKKIYERAVKLGFEHWKYTEYKGMGHSFWVDWEKIEKWLFEQKRTQKPFNITFTCDRPSKAYWAEITEKLTQNRDTHIDIKIASQRIEIKTFNIADYTLYLKDAPIKVSQEITIIENSHKIFNGLLAENGIFSRELDGFKNMKIQPFELIGGL